MSCGLETSPHAMTDLHHSRLLQAVTTDSSFYSISSDTFLFSVPFSGRLCS
jgi:hypothetical protein